MKANLVTIKAVTVKAALVKVVTTKVVTTKVAKMLLGLIVCLVATIALAETKSLRGNHSVDSPSGNAQIKHWQDDKEPITRDYIQQPPLIPHSVESYRINLKFNKCLTCHSWANYKEAKATKISQTHFEDREGQVLANVSARRYFCLQCHVPQVDAKPLIENEFEPVQAITGH
ncbi:MAG: nitrate reductase cytochrome c-type subunit [Gammaproteobacteria bacterium]|jgi:cytochrome c-type protein NapB